MSLVASSKRLHSAALEPEGASVTELGPLLDVTAVRVLARYFVELTFADGTERIIDLGAMLWGPMFEPLLADYQLFRRVAVDPNAGTIVWPNGADVSPRTLYLESKPSMLADDHRRRAEG